MPRSAFSTLIICIALFSLAVAQTTIELQFFYSSDCTGSPTITSVQNNISTCQAFTVAGTTLHATFECATGGTLLGADWSADSSCSISQSAWNATALSGVCANPPEATPPVTYSMIHYCPGYYPPVAAPTSNAPSVPVAPPSASPSTSSAPNTPTPVSPPTAAPNAPALVPTPTANVPIPYTGAIEITLYSASGCTSSLVSGSLVNDINLCQSLTFSGFTVYVEGGCFEVNDTLVVQATFCGTGGTCDSCTPFPIAASDQCVAVPTNSQNPLVHSMHAVCPTGYLSPPAVNPLPPLNYPISPVEPVAPIPAPTPTPSGDAGHILYSLLLASFALMATFFTL